MSTQRGTEKKRLILEFIAQNPGVKTIDIDVDGLSRSSLGAYTKILLDDGLLVKDDNLGWHIATGHVISLPPKMKTSIDFAEEVIREMVKSSVQK